jgi:hypothetical protein
MARSDIPMEEGTMKKSVVFLVFAMLTAILSGCILSKTPSTNDVNLAFNAQMTFSVKVFPTNATYTWTLDGNPISNTGNSYLYTALGGNHTLVVKAKHFLSTDTQSWNITTPSPPVANAGPDQTVFVDSEVTLDGSGSTDPNNDIDSYQWQQTDGPIVTLANANSSIAQFSAIVVNGSVLTFQLTVTDATGLQATDTCVITVVKSILGLFNTGVDDLGVVQDVGALELHYIMTGPVSCSFVIQTDNVWHVPPVNSAWIGPLINGDIPAPPGDYNYILTFDLTGLDPANIEITGSMAADNQVKIFLNGVYTGISTPGDPGGGDDFRNLHSFTLNSGFVEGINTLNFLVTNLGGGNSPTGLLVTDLIMYSNE